MYFERKPFAEIMFRNLTPHYVHESDDSDYDHDNYDYYDGSEDKWVSQLHGGAFVSD